MLEGKHYVCQHLGEPIFVDVAVLGSYSHRTQWLWTNLAPPFIFIVAFFVVSPPFGQNVNDILDPHRTSLPVILDDLPPPGICQQIGAPTEDLPHFFEFSIDIGIPRSGP